MKTNELKKVLGLQPKLQNGMVLIDPALFNGCDIPIYTFYMELLRKAGYRPATERETFDVRLEICRGLSTSERLIVLSGEPYKVDPDSKQFSYKGDCYLWISSSWSIGTANLFDHNTQIPLRFFDSTVSTLLKERVRLLVVKL